ncbi:MAG: choice-of-anchor B family protein [Bacteroidota bacterium]|nr:choice-of-anchor B family protein [Bacteroidota bacterium]
MKYLFLFFIFLMLGNNSQVYAQLGNKNMYLLSNLNNHSAAGDYSAIWGYKAPDGREYGILGCYSGTSFVDITDVNNIHEVGFLPSTNPASFNNPWREMKTYSHYAYIVSEVSNSGIQIVDLQYLPDSIHYVKKFVPAGHIQTHSISQSGPYLYLNGCSANSFGRGVTVFDLTIDPETPVKRGAYNVDYIHDCRIVNDTIYAANINSSKVTIINATNKNLLTRITSFVNLPNAGPHNVALTDDRKYIFVTDEIGSFPRLMKVWNIEDLSDITYMTSWQPTDITTSIVHNVEIYGNYAVAGHYTAGLRFIDISNPVAPTEVAWYDTYPSDNNGTYEGCWGLYMFPSGKIVASDRSTGLYVLKLNFNINVAIEGFYNPASNSLNMRDTVRAYLREVNSPFNIIDSSEAVLDSLTLTGNFKFNAAPAGIYYISLKHRNSIETWSKIGGESYNPMTFQTYDFTNSDVQAYGENVVNVDNSPVRFAMYSGDVNQDGAVDITDLGYIENDASSFNTGYINSDLNGDNLADITDESIADNNAFMFVVKITP